MPAGYSSRCKVCNSQHRVQIEKWAKEEGMSPRAISSRLKEEYGEEISYKSIWQHLNEHFDVKAEVMEQYQKSQEQLQRAVQKHLSDIEMLDSIAQSNYELYQGAKAWLEKILKEKIKAPPKSLVDLLSVTASEVRQQFKQKQELLGESPEKDALENLADVLKEAWDVLKDEK